MATVFTNKLTEFMARYDQPCAVGENQGLRLQSRIAAAYDSSVYKEGLVV